MGVGGCAETAAVGGCVGTAAVLNQWPISAW